MTLREEAEQLAEDRPTSLSDDLYQWAMDAEEMLWKLSAQAAQPAHHIEQDLKMVQPAQVPGWLPIESAPATANNVLAFSASGNMSIQTGHCLRNMLHAAKVDGDLCNYTHWMPLPAAPSPKEGQP